ATKTRARIVTAAAATLGTAEGIRGFSLQAVADRAGVTRLTVYNQFGSRSALLEAVFDEMAARGGLHRIPAVMAGPGPQAGLLEGLAIFFDFLGFGFDALGPFHAARASGPGFWAGGPRRQRRRRRCLS